MIIIWKAGLEYCLTVHFYDESVVTTTSVRINFRENVMATFDLIAKGGYMSFRKNKTKKQAI